MGREKTKKNNRGSSCLGLQPTDKDNMMSNETGHSKAAGIRFTPWYSPRHRVQTRSPWAAFRSSQTSVAGRDGTGGTTAHVAHVKCPENMRTVNISGPPAVHIRPLGRIFAPAHPDSPSKGRGWKGPEEGGRRGW